MNLIVNVSRNWGIGIDGDMLVSISADLKRFRSLTTGGTVIMGRSTLESLPGGRPLKNRRNIVITTRPDDLPDGSEGTASVKALVNLLSGEPSDKIFVIGGQSVYGQLLPLCDRAFVTKTDVLLPADKYFPDLDSLPQWQIEAESEYMEENGLRFKYVDYVKKAL